jgi:hypothetical protein
MNVEGRIHMAIEVRLVRLACIKTETLHGPDSAYLNYNGERVAGPRDINDGESWDLGIVRPIFGVATVDLFDKDSPDADDFLGRATITTGELNLGMRNKDLKEDDAHYTLYYRVDEFVDG